MIKRLILLSAKRKYGRPFCRIERFDLQKRLVRRKPHLSAERVDFFDEMSLCRTTYGRITRHKRNGAEIEAQHQSFFIQSCACKRGFDTCVSAAYDNDVKFFHIMFYSVCRLNKRRFIVVFRIKLYIRFITRTKRLQSICDCSVSQRVICQRRILRIYCSQRLALPSCP